METEVKREIVENTTLQTLGISAVSAGVVALQVPNQLASGIALAAVGVILLAIKYWRNV